ncbi:MAG: Gfo/Idh/MocA family oxidoreductase, partial [bacterium]|nr:Gfo/Idh/MocA family oxidoreductase [bacterium]
MTSELNRRKFVGSAAATTGAFAIVPRHVLGGAAFVPPSDKITLAHIGMGTQSFRELESLLASPAIQIVAVCDPNTDSNDYVEWGKNSIRRTIRKLLGKPMWRENGNGCPGGREVGREVIDTYYANQRGAEKFKACAAYADFRELLDKEKDVDAVKVMTPDHLHAAISIAAMKKGQHVIMHKPLANRMHEARLTIETARKRKVATHLLAYGSGAANAAIAGKVKQGVIGKLREIHNWSNRPVWPQYPEIPKDRPPAPKGMDWDLWLGPSLDRPYHPHYTHTVFRGWYEFGGGSMADMGIYSLWPVFTELNLGTPISAQALASHTCSIIDHVSRPAKNDFSFPAACSLRLQFAATAEMPALELFWYDGGMKPRLPAEIEAHDVPLSREGILFVGDEGSILAGFHGTNATRFA